jgi:methanogenic corrinoid protein MtbC1
MSAGGPLRRSAAAATFANLEVCATRGDMASVRSLLAIARARYDDADAYVAEVLVPLLHWVGAASHRHTITHEHAVAFVTHVAADFDAASATGGTAAPARRPATAPVAVACPAGEWHELPARMVAGALRRRGWNVVELGAGVATEFLESWVRAHDPVAVALSCTVAAFLPELANAVRRVHEAGAPVLAGGAAFGRDDRRARALGADGWCADPVSADRVLRHWARRSPRADAATATVGPAMSPLRDDERAEIIDAVLRVIERQRRDDVQWGAARTGAAELLAVTLGFLEAAALTGDDSLLSEQMEWWLEGRDSRRADADTAIAAMETIAGAVPPGPLRSLILRSFAARTPERAGAGP